MKNPTSTRRDKEVQAAVQQELDWTPDVDAAGIGVAVEDATVTLSGEVNDVTEGLAAKRAALRVRGVTSLVDDLRVRPRAGWPITDAALAQEVQHALQWASNVPDTVKAEINDHAVKLVGHADWDYQRQAAVGAVQSLRGVSSVINAIELSTRPSALDAEQRIKSALARHAELDAESIKATVSGSTVTLTGTVRSWAQKLQAGQAAWASPHVSDVDNRIVVRAF